MFEFLSQESKQQIKDQLKVEETDFDQAKNKRIHYKSNFIEEYLKTTEPIMSRFEYIQIVASILANNPLWSGKKIWLSIMKQI